jgi:sugar phosphate isomerase/epimerase
VQVKVEIKRAGAAAESADMNKIAAILREANYQGWVVLEYEARPDPFTAVPEHLKALRAALG